MSAKPISEMSTIVTYRCECRHPTRDGLSAFYTDNARTADAYKAIGWTITPLTQYDDPNTRMEEAFCDTEMRIEAAVAQSREGVHEVYCSTEDGNPFDKTDTDAGKPFCRIEWYADGGDPSVGIPATYGWALAGDQAGTLLEEQVMMGKQATDGVREDAPPETAMIDAAMVEMQNIHPPLRRSDCKRLIRAALGSASDGVASGSTVAGGIRNDTEN